MRREYTKRPDKFDAGLSELSDVQLKITSFAYIFREQVGNSNIFYVDKQNMVLITLFQRVVTPRGPHFIIIHQVPKYHSRHAHTMSTFTPFFGQTKCLVES